MSTLSQFGSGIKSIQRGTVSVSAAAINSTGTATISAVDTAKSVISYLGHAATGAGFSNVSEIGAVTLTDSTTVTGYVGTSTGSHPVPVGYVVTEYY